MTLLCRLRRDQLEAKNEQLEAMNEQVGSEAATRGGCVEARACAQDSRLPTSTSFLARRAVDWGGKRESRYGQGRLK